MVKQIFRFNKNSRKQAIKTFETLERSTLFGAVIGAFTVDPLWSAVGSLLVFGVCRFAVVYITGIEDASEEGDKPATPRTRRATGTTRKRRKPGDDTDGAA